MRSIRTQISLPIFLLIVACGVLFTIYNLSSLHHQLGLTIESAINAQWRVTGPELHRWTPGALEVGEWAGMGESTEVLLFDSSGSLVWKKEKSQNRDIVRLELVHPPESFLEYPSVGLIFRPHTAGVARGVRFAAIVLPTRTYAAQYRSARSRTMLLTFLVSIALGGLALVLSGRVSKRIVMIQDFAAKLTKAPSPQSQDRNDKDEIETLAAILETTYHNIEHNNLEIERLQHIRSQFLANVSHEVRTPLFSLKGYLETLLDGGIDDPKVNKTFVESAYRQAQRLDSLLKDLIEISRIESGEMRMSFRYFPVGPLLDKLLEEHHAEAERRKQTITVRAPDPLTEIVGDRDRLEQALGNLLDNAIKYSPEGSKIILGAVEKPNGVVLSVTDNGPGIAPEHLSRLFERFYRVDVDRSREVGGTGLGLAIVKHIVEAHDSKVHATSDLGKGTSFYFEIRT